MPRYLTGNAAPSPEAELRAATPYAPEIPGSVGTLEGLQHGFGALARTLAGEQQQAIANQRWQQQFALRQQEFRRRAQEREERLRAHKQAMQATNELLKGVLPLDPHSLKDEDVLTHGMEVVRRFNEYAPNFRDARAQEAARRRLFATPLMQRYQMLRAAQKARAQQHSDVLGRQIRLLTFKAVPDYTRAASEASQLASSLQQLESSPPPLENPEARAEWERSRAILRQKLLEARARQIGLGSTLMAWFHNPETRQYMDPSAVALAQQIEQQKQVREAAAARQAELEQQRAREQAAARHFQYEGGPSYLGLPANPAHYTRLPDGRVRYVIPGRRAGILTPKQYDALKQRYTNLPKRDRLPAWRTR